MPYMECKPLESSAKRHSANAPLQMPRFKRFSTSYSLHEHAEQKIDKVIQFKHKHAIQNKSITRQFNFEMQPKYSNLSQPLEKEFDGRNNVLFFKNFDKYISEIEFATDIKVPEAQKTLLKEFAKTHSLEHLNKQERDHSRNQYNKLKSSIIEDWEKNNNAKWPYTGKEPEYYNGKLISNRPTRYQLHHIILISYGGPNVWWNMHPAPPIKHQEIIHGENSVSKKIFA